MILIKLNNLSLSYGQHPLLNEANLQVEAGQHICLIGRNGAGKSTLLKLITGQGEPDGGSLEIKQGTVVSMLPQAVPQDFSGSIFEKVAEGLGELGHLLSQYEQVNHTLSKNSSPELLHRLSELQHAIERQDGWRLHQRVNKIISQTSLDPNADVSSLSGGMKRRVLLAKALVTDPDVLILDEPTNHLDIEAITWLENFLRNFKKTLIFVSHDRAFMQAVANQIVELDLGKITSWSGSYQDFLVHKENMLAAEATQQALFDKKLAEEEAWIRQGIKARRTRNEGRVRALKKMRQQRAERQTRIGKADITTQKHDLSGKIVFEAQHISQNYQGTPLIKDFSTTVLRGDKIGILGPNGSGKTTLLNILLGKLKPDHGMVKFGTKLKIAYFDQHRQQLDPEKTAQECVYDGGDMIDFNGKSIHVMSYLQKFLFSPDRARTKVKVFSGGERNRLLLAKLFTTPANVLVLDEPTNDLDVETLELLEELLIDYQGTVLMVSHDRSFLNNIVTSTIAFEGHGNVHEYVGGYDDWLRQRQTQTATKEKSKTEKTKSSAQTNKKLSYKEKYELEHLPEKIGKLESDIENLQAEMMHPDFYQAEQDAITDKKKRLQDLEKKLEDAYLRWETLENKNQ